MTMLRNTRVCPVSSNVDTTIITGYRSGIVFGLSRLSANFWYNLDVVWSMNVGQVCRLAVIIRGSVISSNRG